MLTSLTGLHIELSGHCVSLHSLARPGLVSWPLDLLSALAVLEGVPNRQALAALMKTFFTLAVLNLPRALVEVEVEADVLTIVVLGVVAHQLLGHLSLRLAFSCCFALPPLGRAIPLSLLRRWINFSALELVMKFAEGRHDRLS